MNKMLTWDDLRSYGERRSKSQIRRDWKAGLFPAPCGYNGKSPFWTPDVIERHIDGLISKHREASNARAT